MKGLLCALLLATSAVAAQQPVDSGPVPRHPRGWIELGGEVGGVGAGPNLTTSLTVGGRAKLAWRFGDRAVLLADAAGETVSNQPQKIATFIGCAEGCSIITINLNSVASGALLLGYLRSSFGTSSMLIAAGPAFVRAYMQGGGVSSSPGLEAVIDQTLMQGSRAAVTVHVSPVWAPTIEYRAFWLLPVGIGVRFW